MVVMSMGNENIINIFQMNAQFLGIHKEYV